MHPLVKLAKDAVELYIREKKVFELRDDDLTEEMKERAGVFAADGKAARFVPVETGMIGGLEIEVKQGLDEGREIAAGPWQSLKDLQDGAAIRTPRK